jgi:hypothetical protein
MGDSLNQVESDVFFGQKFHFEFPDDYPSLDLMRISAFTIFQLHPFPLPWTHSFHFVFCVTWWQAVLSVANKHRTLWEKLPGAAIVAPGFINKLNYTPASVPPNCIPGA